MKYSNHKIIAKYVEGLNKDLANSLLIVGNAGTGKTETIANSLKNFNLKRNIHYRWINNYITPLSLFHILEETNELERPKILIIDDCEQMLSNQTSVSILRSALWPIPNGEREVHWHSTSSKVESSSFVFEGKIIILLNKLNTKNELVRALIDRGFFLNLTFTNRELIGLMRERAKLPYRNLSPEQRIKVIDFIAENGLSSRHLSLRTLQTGYNLRILSPNHWMTLLKELL